MKASQPSQPESSKALASQAKADAIISQLADDFRPLVEKIEESVPTTKDHYDRWMYALSQFPKGPSRDVVVLALLKAGANKNGVLWALKLIE